MKKLNLTKDQIIENIINFFEKKDIYFMYGKDQWDQTVIAVENWNDEKIPAKLEYFVDRLEHTVSGYCESYMYCDHCSKLIYTDCSGQSDSRFFDNGVLCRECIKEDFTDDYITHCMENPEIADISFLPENYLENEGFEKVNKTPFESGLYEGMNDDPLQVLNGYHKEGYDLLLVKSDQNPFMIAFNIYQRKDEFYDE